MAASQSSVTNLARSVATISQMVNTIYLNTDVTASSIIAPDNTGITLTASKNYDIALKTSGVGSVTIGDMSLSNSTIESSSGITMTATKNNDVSLITSGTGNVNIGNFTIQDDTIQNENESYVVVKNNDLNLITDAGYKTYITNITTDAISGITTKWNSGCCFCNN